MRTFFRLKNRQPGNLPSEFRDEDVRYPPELVALFVRRYTRQGDVVFDPFAGFGTTLVVAEQLGRVPSGVEYEPRRVAYIRSLLTDPGAIIHGDSRRLMSYELPRFALAITSPPFTEHSDTVDALENYARPGAGYKAYLEQMGSIARQLRRQMLPGARVVMEVANLKGPGGVTPLAWDLARVVGEVLRFEGEIVIGWDSYAYGYDHSYCLIFSDPT
jgi:hypothetical protein